MCIKPKAFANSAISVSIIDLWIAWYWLATSSQEVFFAKFEYWGLITPFSKIFIKVKDPAWVPIVAFLCGLTFGSNWTPKYSKS